MHYLSVLTEESHPGAQAYLADLLWRGRHVKKDERRALALITMAVENAPEHERIWIEDIYQNIYCGAAQGVRKQATGIVADWRTRYGRKPDMRDDTGLGPLNVQATRTCGNGEPVLFDMGTNADVSPTPTAPLATALPKQADGSDSFAKGTAASGMRDIGASTSTPAPAR